MTFLSSLKLTAYEDIRPSAIERRRMKLIENLKDQLSLLDNPTHAKTRSKWVKEGEAKTFKERIIPVRPWWREMPDGELAFFVRSGLKKIEFKKGQSAILVQNKQSLPTLINGLIEAVKNGEFDSLLREKEVASPTQRKRAA